MTLGSAEPMSVSLPVQSPEARMLMQQVSVVGYRRRKSVVRRQAPIVVSVSVSVSVPVPVGLLSSVDLVQ